MDGILALGFGGWDGAQTASMTGRGNVPMLNEQVVNQEPVELIPAMVLGLV